jgi:hypothetical protein
MLCAFGTMSVLALDGLDGTRPLPTGSLSARVVVLTAYCVPCSPKSFPRVRRKQNLDRTNKQPLALLPLKGPMCP